MCCFSNRLSGYRERVLLLLHLSFNGDSRDADLNVVDGFIMLLHFMDDWFVSFRSLNFITDYANITIPHLLKYDEYYNQGCDLEKLYNVSLYNFIILLEKLIIKFLKLIIF